MPATVVRRPSTILVWQAGALGDTLLAYPALAALRNWAPQARVSAIGHPSNLAPAQWTGLVDQVLDVDGPLSGALLIGSPPPALEAPELAVIWSAAFQQLAATFQSLGVHSLLCAPARATAARHQSRYLLDMLLPLGL